MDTQSTEQKRDTKPGFVRRSFFIALIILLIYILGSGPAYRLAETRFLSEEAVDVVYAPLWGLCVQTTISYNLLGWYIHLWEPTVAPTPTVSAPKRQ